MHAKYCDALVDKQKLENCLVENCLANDCDFDKHAGALISGGVGFCEGQ
jgi:hypothetical protein